MSKNFFLKRNQFLPIYARLKRATVGRRTYETNISISSAIEEAPSKKPHRALPFSRRASEASMKVYPEGRDSGRKEGQNAGVKNPQKPKAFTLVFNGRDWTVGFRGGLKWRSRRNGKTHQNEIQDSDRPWRRRESLEKIRIYFISLSARIHKCFFFLPSFPPLPYPLSLRACSPLDGPPADYLFATPVSGRSLAWCEKAAFFSRGTPKQNSWKYVRLKRLSARYSTVAILDAKNTGNYVREIMPVRLACILDISKIHKVEEVAKDREKWQCSNYIIVIIV